MNPYCRAHVPSLRVVQDQREANTFSLLIVALLEAGRPLTLEEVAERFEEAGIAPARRALAALQRCRPARSPIFRDGDLYALDPHQDEADLWAFRLNLRPPRAFTLWSRCSGCSEPICRGKEPGALRAPALELGRRYIPERDPNSVPSEAPFEFYDAEQSRSAVAAAEKILGFCQRHLAGPRRSP